MKNKKPIKGEDLRTRIMRLFQKAGFETKPRNKKDKELEVELSSGKKRPIDLLVKAEGLKIMVECTGKKIDSITSFTHDKIQIGKAAKADKVLLVITNKEIKEEDRDFIHSLEAEVWTEKDIKYYEAIVSAIGEWAKYEIIHSLGLHTSEEKIIHNVYALKINQPLIDSETEVFLFSINPQFLLKTAAIFRKARFEAETYQRMLRKKRLPNIAKFVSKPDAIFPVDIILALSNKVKTIELDNSLLKDKNGSSIIITRPDVAEIQILQLPLEYASLEVIDGQHRLFGFARVEDDNVLKNFNLIVAGIKGLNFPKKRDLFVSINDNSRRVDPNLVAYLKYTDDETECRENPELMAIKISVELNKESPFKNKIRLLDIGEQKITLKGFSGYDLRKLISPRGMLRKYYPENSSEEYVKLLRMYFSAVRDVLRTQWDNPKKYIVATNRGISAFLRLLRSILKTERKKLTYNDIKKYLLPLKSFDFRTDILKGEYIGAAGWKRFHEDLVNTIRKEFPEFGK